MFFVEEDSFQSRSLGYCFFVDFVAVLVVLVWDNHGFIHRHGLQVEGLRKQVLIHKSTQISNQNKSSLKIKSLQ